MANEATVSSTLRIVKDNVRHEPGTDQFKADVAASPAKGPVPGAIQIEVTGTDVDLSELATLGLGRIGNLEADGGNYFDYGIWDPEGARFYPLGRVLPGEFYPLRLSPDLAEEFATGTGTEGANTNTLRLKANTAAVQGYVGVFEA